MPDLSLLDAVSKAQLTPDQLQEFADHPTPEEGPVNTWDNPPAPPESTRPAISPDSTKEVFLDHDSFSKLNSEQFKEFADNFPAGTSIKIGSKPKPVATKNHPPDLDPEAIKQSSPEDLVDFSRQTKWSPYTWAQSHPEHLDPDTLKKLALTDTQLRKEGLTWADIPVGEAVMALPHLVGGVIDYAKLVERVQNAEPGSPEYIKAKAELTAASETSSMGTADLARRTFNHVGRLTGLKKPLEDFTPEDSLELFQNELAIRNQMAKIVSGGGEATKFLGGEGLRELQETGVKLDESAIQSASAGDPISFAAFGKGFKLFNTITGKTVGYALSKMPAVQAVEKLNILRGSAARAAKLAEGIPSVENVAAKEGRAFELASERAAAGSLARGIEQVGIAGEKAVQFAQEAPGWIAGKATQGLGKALQGASETIKRFGSAEIIGTLAHGDIPAAIGGFVASVARPLIEKAGVGLENLGKTVAEANAPGGTWARAVQDITKAPAQAIGGAAKGFAPDLGLMNLSSETPEEQRESPFMMTAFGAAHGLLLAGAGFAKGQLLAPRPWVKSNSWAKSYGNFPELDKIHAETMKIASPGVKTRLGALRDLASAVGSEMYQFSGAESLAKFLESQGHTPEDARTEASNNAIVLGEFKGKDGKPRKVMLLRDPESAPHEVGHPLMDALSQEQQTWYLNELLKVHGEDAVMARAKREAHALSDDTTNAELTLTPDSWKNFLLRITGRGEIAAKGKVAQHPELAGKPWDLVLSEPEKDNLVKGYALEEIGADNIAKALEHNGAGLDKDSTVLGVAARTIAKLLTIIGVDPYAGETAGSQGMPIKPEALEAAQKIIGPALLEARKGKAPEGKPVIPFPKAGGGFAAPPGTPAQEAKKTEEYAAGAPDTPTGPETDAQSQREILGIFSESKARGQGVKITRRSAPGTPAGAIEVTRKGRRVQIEKARNIPDAQKPLWEKNFTPVKTVVTKDGIQEQGWSPEVLAANTEKAVKFLSGTDPSKVPYEIDPATGRLTGNGWQELFDDVNTYAGNQAAGLTGKGTPIDIGEGAKFGLFKPAGDEQAVGTLTDAKANFINYLFGQPLPGEGKPTLARGGKAQYAHQLGTEATEPGRAQPLVEKRTFESPQARELGFAGEQLLEVNPLRAEIEALATKDNPAPSPIEVWQNLNVRDIVKAEIAPELPAVRPNLTTIRMGFQSKPENPRAVRSAAVRDESGKIFEGSWHGEAAMKALTAPGERGDLEQGFVNNEGKWYDKETATKVAEEIGQMPVQADRELESGNFERTRAFQSKKQEIELTGPDGKTYKALFDGYQDFSAVGKGWVAQITPLEDLPGMTVKGSTTYTSQLEKKGYSAPELPSPPEGPTAFQSKKQEPRVGLEFKKFFSDVTKGTFGKSDKPFEPILDLSDNKDIIQARAKHSGNFDDHIAKSIPTFYESQIKKAKAIAQVYGDSGARVLDIAASEGSFGKSISDLTGGKVETVSLDPNPDMANFFETKSQVPGATYSTDSFLNGFLDVDGEHKAHSPAEPYDVITESMGFQFIDPDRGSQIAEVKRMLKPDGVFLTEEKVKNPDWASNEAKKDAEYKAKYFSTDELKQKDTRVGFAQAKDEAKAVGMVNNMVEQSALEAELQNNFKHVVQYWDSGNFKGYAAGDDAAKVDAVVSAMGDTKSKFSTIDLPREIEPVPSAEELSSFGREGARFQSKEKDLETISKQFRTRSSKPVAMKFGESVAKKIADFHDEAPGDSIDDATRKSYNSFNQETLKQFQVLEQAGYVLEPWEGSGEPYKNSAEMRADVQENKHLFYLPSKSALGDDAAVEVAKYPPLEDSGVRINGQSIPFNDLFRAVHDVFGHALNNRSFSKDGEFQAWQDHAQMYSESSQPALALETLVYNSWFNAGKHLRRADGSLPVPGDADYVPLRERGYAPRKTYLLPKDLIQEAKGEFPSETEASTFGREGARFQAKRKEDVDTLDLVHYSSNMGLKEVSPKFFGKGKTTPSDLRGSNKTFFYVKGSAFGQDEPIFKDTGLHSYETQVSKKNLYDLSKGQPDPLDWRSTPNREEADDNVRAAGYHGILLDTADGRQVVAMFKPLKVKPSVAEGKPQIAFQSGQGVVGKVDEYGEITAKKGDLSRISHNSIFAGGEAWRYVKDTGEVFWWFQKPEQKLQDAVTAWLEKKGNPVSTHKVLGEGTTESDFSRSHGRFQSKAPKREDFENPETLTKALASPGWAIITATREAVGPWDHPDNIAANERLAKELKSKGYDVLPVSGTYKGVPQGTDLLVTGIDTQDAQALGKKYGQESIMTNEGWRYSNGDITPGRPEDTLIGDEARKQPNYNTLPNGLSFSVPMDFEEGPEPKPVGEQTDLFGGKHALSSRIAGEMTNTELKSHFPEAIVPAKVRSEKTGELVEPKLDSNIVESPLYKQAGSREAAVEEFKKKLVDFVSKWKDHPAYQSGLKWYSEFVPMLKKHFPGYENLMAQLLAATSPQTNPEQNFAYALDALEMFKSGKFKTLTDKFGDGLKKIADGSWEKWYADKRNVSEPAANPDENSFLKAWVEKYDLKPKQSNGKLYGKNGAAVLQVLAGVWLERNAGLKTNQFVRNLLGVDHGPTIDLWADRTMRRLGYEDFQDRWRILPKNQAGVSDPDFHFSQAVFHAAAKELGIKADALQGGAWFAEKQHWANNGWGTLDLGDYRDQFEKIPMLKSGISQRLTATKQRAKVKPMETMEFALEPRPKK